MGIERAEPKVLGKAAQSAAQMEYCMVPETAASLGNEMVETKVLLMAIRLVLLTVDKTVSN